MLKQLIIVILGIVISHLAQAQKVKVACLSDEFSLGSAFNNKENQTWPVQLGYMLGSSYELNNFSYSQATLTDGADCYLNSSSFQSALTFSPDIVLINLGLNDARAMVQGKSVHLEKNYETIIRKLLEANDLVRVVLIRPSGIGDEAVDAVLKEKIIPVIEGLAFLLKVEIIDVYSTLLEKDYPWIEDKRLTALGSEVWAKTLYETITMKSEHDFNVLNELSVFGPIDNFYGYEKKDFELFGWSCKVVMPKKTVIGRPWIWRARFWGHEPQAEIALLQRGFHVAYIDVADLYGSAEAIERWNRFYEFFTRGGMSTKPVLEGMSRGGLIVYNWAAANPEKVGAVYADAPVLDLMSWPKGDGLGEGSPEDWEKVQMLYRINSPKRLEKFEGNPLDKVKVFADAGFPSLLVAGDRDKVVPLAENAQVFEQKINELGGKASLIVKKGAGHHPHSFRNPEIIVDFILKATGLKTNYAAVPHGGSEFRAAAGWVSGVDWWDNHREISSLLTEKRPDIVFLGNSISQGTGGNRKNVTSKPGLDAFSEVFSDFSWENAGISGDRVEHIQFRLVDGKYEQSNARLIVLTIGVNNFAENKPKEIADAIGRIVYLIESRIPDTKILLLGSLPAGKKPDSEKRKSFEELHQHLETFDWGDFVTYKKLYKEFCSADDSLSPVFYHDDGIHLKPAGYKKWAELIKPDIDLMLQ